MHKSLTLPVGGNTARNILHAAKAIAAADALLITAGASGGSGPMSFRMAL